MNKQNRILNFGIIGCGRVSKIHTSVLSNMPGAKLVAVCDIVEERGRIYEKNFGCKFYKDYRDLIKSKDVDVVNICTPTYLHAQMAIAAAKNGKHVISEKPIALSLIDADAMICAAQENNVKLFVVKQNRYNPPILKLKEALDEGRFGKIFYGNTSIFWQRDQSYYDQHEWFGQLDKGGGVIINQASHNIDMLQWLMGPVESVYAKIDTMTHKIKTEDLGLAILKFKSGAWGTIVATTSVFPRNIEGSVSIFGENGTVKVAGIQLNEMQIWEFKDYRTEDGLYSRYSTTPPNIYGFGHIKFMEDAISAINEDKRPFIDGQEAKPSLELILALYKSAQTGKEINIADFRAEYYAKH